MTPTSLGLLLAALAPAPEPKIIDLVTLLNGHCALRDDGRVVCWGRHPSFPTLLGIDEGRPGRAQRLKVPTVVPKLPKCKAIALGIQGWGVTEAGALVTWGPASKVNVERLGKVSDVVGALATICARLENGAVKCWDPADEDAPVWELRASDGGPLPAGDLRSGAHPDAFEIHDAQGAFRIELARAWPVRGADERHVAVERVASTRPSWPEAYALRRLGRRMKDAVVRGDCMLAEQRVWCWSDPRAISWTPQVVGVADVVGLAQEWLCLGRGETVRCHRRGGGVRSFALGAKVTMVHVGERSGIFGAADGRVIVVGLGSGNSEPGSPKIRRDFRVRGTPVLADDEAERTCVFVREGSRQCIGDRSDTVTSTKVDGVALSVDRGRNMMRLDDGRIAEVMHDGSIETVHPTSDAAFTMGYDRTVIFDGTAVLVHGGPGRIENWLEPAELSGHAPVRDRPSIAQSELQTCVIDQAGAVHCSQVIPGLHGGVDLPLRTAPWATEVPLGGPAVALVGARRAVCARLGNGEVACWGERYGGAEGLAPQGEITDVIASAR